MAVVCSHRQQSFPLINGIRLLSPTEVLSFNQWQSIAITNSSRFLSSMAVDCYHQQQSFHLTNGSRLLSPTTVASFNQWLSSALTNSNRFLLSMAVVLFCFVLFILLVGWLFFFLSSLPRQWKSLSLINVSRFFSSGSRRLKKIYLSVYLLSIYGSLFLSSMAVIFCDLWQSFSLQWQSPFCLSMAV